MCIFDAGALIAAGQADRSIWRVIDKAARDAGADSSQQRYHLHFRPG